MSDISFLPIDFVNRMEQDLGPDFHAFLSSYEENKISALRFNPVKADSQAIKTMEPMLTGQVDWSPNGYYYDEATRPGLHPYHMAGLFYIQDASAQLPVEFLDPRPGDYCLDLCAAPGGKSTQIAGKLMGQGLLVSNEPMKNRAKILSENVERLGIVNAIVTSEYPDKLASKFHYYFDKIMVDAPCSGEGMFRKNHEAADEWSLENVTMCAARQGDILDNAYLMLIPGGRLCYSTCTFSKEEDEEAVAAFISRHPDMTLIKEKRLWPHEVKGEGHYVALLEKADDGSSDEIRANRPKAKLKAINKALLNDYLTFQKETLNISIEDNLLLINDLLYRLPEGCPDLSGLHIIRGGLFLGTIKKNRFEPSHALALALKDSEVKNTFNLSSGSKEANYYLKGQSLTGDVKDGWTLVLVDGYSIGWGKAVKGQIKNHFPKGLRLLG
ncbi:MAG: RsmF rRNA methyltransferase first C-terminal domain-containing protein [Pseudobutyrivibrio sp.]|nr:RsmF rRNA methyltransferase first C-terminal domain-containing protein [Pseudobutyrivibrio sp.]